MKIKDTNKRIVSIIAGLVLFFPTMAIGATYFLSPTGSDYRTNAQAQSEGTPWKSFSKAFSSISGGDELVLLDGTYSESAGTGYISYLGNYSSQPPSGIDKNRPTIIRAKTSGAVRVEGSLFLGRSTRKDSYIKLQDISFEGGGYLYNTSYIYLKGCGFLNGFLGVGTNDHNNGNTNNLIEDCWVFAKDARGIAMNYRADYNVWRRVVIRGDGCSLSECAGSGNPNIGFTVYNSKYCSIQNVIIIDRILNGGSAYGDFATAQHAGSSAETPLQGNEWLGCISINSEDTGFHMEADAAIAPSHYIQNCVVAAKRPIIAGFNFNYARGAVVENSTVWVGNNSTSIILYTHGDSSTGSITRNVIAKGNATYALNRMGSTSNVNTYGTFSGGIFNNMTAQNSITSNPESDGAIASLKYPVRIEDGSKLKGAGYEGSDIGANVVYRYGVDGSFWNDPGYKSLSGVQLWPWPYEDRIKDDMSEGSTRGFCSNGKQLDGENDITLTSYIWEYFGNKMPSNFNAPLRVPGPPPWK